MIFDNNNLIARNLNDDWTVIAPMQDKDAEPSLTVSLLMQPRDCTQSKYFQYEEQYLLDRKVVISNVFQQIENRKMTDEDFKRFGFLRDLTSKAHDIDSHLVIYKDTVIGKLKTHLKKGHIMFAPLHAI